MRKLIVFACLLTASRSFAQGASKVCTPVAGGSVICTESKPATTAGAVTGGLAGIVQGLAIDKANTDANAAASAQQQLFVDRAIMVIRQGRDSLAFSATDRAAKLDSLYWDEAATAVGRLYTVNPAAPTQQIRESVEPVIDKYRRLKRP